MISLHHSGDDAVPLLKDIRYPPEECWFLLEALGNGKLSVFYRIQFLEIGESFPRSGAIFPLDTELPALCCLAKVSIVSTFDVHVGALDGSTVLMPVNDLLHEVLVTFSIAVRVHVLDDYIRRVFGCLAIEELDLVRASIKNGIGIGLAFDCPIVFTFAAFDLPDMTESPIDSSTSAPT